MKPLIPGNTPTFKLIRNGVTIKSLTSVPTYTTVEYPLLSTHFSPFSLALLVFEEGVRWQDMLYNSGGGLTCDRPYDEGTGYYAYAGFPAHLRRSSFPFIFHQLPHLLPYDPYVLPSAL